MANKRYNFLTDSRVNLYDYEGWVKNKKNDRRFPGFSGRVFDVSVDSLKRKLVETYGKGYTWKIKRLKTNPQLRNSREYKNFKF